MIRVAVGIVRQDGKILVGQRPQNKTYSGYWEFPGGKIEPNESSEAALVRELHEELGIHILNPQHWLDVTHSYPDKTVALEIWLIDAFNGEPQEMEGQVLRWVSLDEMSDLKLLEGNWEILEALQSLVNT